MRSHRLLPSSHSRRCGEGRKTNTAYSAPRSGRYTSNASSWAPSALRWAWRRGPRNAWVTCFTAGGTLRCNRVSTVGGEQVDIQLVLGLGPLDQRRQRAGLLVLQLVDRAQDEARGGPEGRCSGGPPGCASKYWSASIQLASTAGHQPEAEKDAGEQLAADNHRLSSPEAIRNW